MKIERKRVFNPIKITIENEEDAEMTRSAFKLYKKHWTLTEEKTAKVDYIINELEEPIPF